MASSKQSRRLQSLTSLRFFFGTLVVAAHLRGVAGVPLDLLEPFAVENSVTFFFVLSGFILTYSYAHQQPLDKRRFLVARFARIWPAHLTALILFVLSFPVSLRHYSLGQLLANLCMLHTWIPISKYNTSFVGASWSISTEFGFYLAFIFLVRNWQRTWHIKLAISACLTIGMMWLANSLTPRYGSDVAEGLMYFHPFTRLFEFVLGMTTAELWKRLGPKVKMNTGFATLVELGLLAVIIWLMRDALAWANLAGILLGTAGTRWLQCAGICCVPLAIFIFVMACERGLLSRFLAFPILVLLGEISYSTYLIHQMFINYIRINARVFDLLPRWLLVSVFSTVTLLSALFLWLLIERPARTFLVRLLTRSRPSEEPESQQLRFPFLPASPAPRREAVLPATPYLRWATIFAGLSLLALLTASAYFASGVQTTTAADAAEILRNTPSDLKSVTFGQRVTLEGFRWRDGRNPNEKQLDLVWRTISPQHLQFRTAVHFVDNEGKIRGQADQEPFGTELAANTMWRTVITLSPGSLAGVTRVALGLLQDKEDWLIADRGPRDWGDRRLLIPLPEPYQNLETRTSPEQTEPGREMPAATEQRPIPAPQEASLVASMPPKAPEVTYPNKGTPARDNVAIGNIEIANSTKFQPVTFGAQFVLAGCRWNPGANGTEIELNLLWQALRAERGFTTDVCLLDAAGNSLWRFRYEDDPAQSPVSPGTFWQKAIKFARADLASGTQLALALSKGDIWLVPDRASKDLDNRRILIPLPPSLAMIAPPENTAFQGYLEAADAISIVGWAWRKQEPVTKLKIDLYDGSVPITTVLATNARPDLVAANIGDGAYGFRVPTPMSLKDGRPHEIRARISGHAFELERSPRMLLLAGESASKAPAVTASIKTIAEDASGR